jgi:hypothetical protein
MRVYSSYKTHRIIVASLFLPHTAVLGESQPSTPAGGKRELPPLNAPPPKGIVEALLDKVRTCPFSAYTSGLTRAAHRPGMGPR